MNANIGWNHPRMTKAEFAAKNKRMQAEERARVEREREKQEAWRAKWSPLFDRRDAERRATATAKAVAA